MDIMKKQKQSSSSRKLSLKQKATSKKSRNIKKINRNNKKKCMCCVSILPTDIPSIWIELRSNRKLCDGIIKTSDGAVFYIHRIVLSTISRYFKAYFTNCLETGETDIKELIINDFPSYLIAVIIDYAYTGKCYITEENVCQIIPVADRFDCIGLLNRCCSFLLNNLKPENCLGLRKFAQNYFCKDVVDKSWCYICSNFTEIYERSEEFLELTAEELREILIDDSLNVKDEIITFQAIEKWINKDSDIRKEYYADLLDCVRFGNLQIDYFNNVRNCKYNNDKAIGVLMAAECIINTRKECIRCVSYDNKMCRPRIPFEILFAVGGWSAGSPTNIVETYDTRADRWFVSNYTDPTPRAYHGLVLLDNLIYMIGGFDGIDHFNTVRCFDPISHTWSEKACMYHARCYVSTCTLSGCIYAIGGYNGRTRMSSVEKYNPSTNQWEQIASMNKQRSDASAATLNSKIYIVGGFSGHEIMRSVEVYNPAVQQWTLVTSMAYCRSGVSLVAHNDFLYAMGGFDGSTRLYSGEKYNPEGGYWEPIADMLCPRSNFSAVVLDDKVYIAGGFNGTTTIANTECYDTRRNEWSEVAAMTLNRSALAACVCKNLVNAKDYSFLSKVSDYPMPVKPEASSTEHDSNVYYKKEESWD